MASGTGCWKRNLRTGSSGEEPSRVKVREMRSVKILELHFNQARRLIRTKPGELRCNRQCLERVSRKVTVCKVDDSCSVRAEPCVIIHVHSSFMLPRSQNYRGKGNDPWMSSQARWSALVVPALVDPTGFVVKRCVVYYF